MKNTAKPQQATTKSQPTSEIRERHHYSMVEAPVKKIGDLELKGHRPYKLLTKTIEQLWTDGIWRPISIVKTGCYSEDP